MRVTTALLVARGTSTMQSGFFVVLGVLALLGLAACGPVPATHRGPLTKPGMEAGDISIGLDGHVRSVSEGATGGLAGGGGGCGCN